MKQSMFAVLAAALLLAGCVSGSGQKSLVDLRAECIAGKAASCAAVGMHPQVASNDAAVAASISEALLDAVAVGVVAQRNGHPRDYAQENRASRQH